MAQYSFYIGRILFYAETHTIPHKKIGPAQIDIAESKKQYFVGARPTHKIGFTNQSLINEIFKSILTTDLDPYPSNLL